LFSSALTQLFSSIFAQSSPPENAVALRQVSPSPGPFVLAGKGMSPLPSRFPRAIFWEARHN
jgi:hypothetical protein